MAVAIALLTACSRGPLSEPVVVAVALKDVSAERLSYRYEADVPAPDPKFLNSGSRVERNEAVQLDFDTNRVREILDRTIASPSGERILAVYRMGDDVISDFRLDMYSKDGKLIRKVTHEEMALQFPDTIVWSPRRKQRRICCEDPRHRPQCDFGDLFRRIRKTRCHSGGGFARR